MMITKNYSFAGVDLQISMAEEVMYINDGYLAPFATDIVSDPHKFVFELCENLPAPEGQCVVKTPAFRVYEENGTATRYIGSVEQSWENAYICAEHSGNNHIIKLKRSLQNLVGIMQEVSLVFMEQYKHLLLNCIK